MRNLFAKGAEFVPSFFFKGCRRSVASNGALFWSAAVSLSPKRARPFLRRGEGGEKETELGQKGKIFINPYPGVQYLRTLHLPWGKLNAAVLLRRGREEGRASGRWGFRHLSPNAVLSPSSILCLNQTK